MKIRWRKDNKWKSGFFFSALKQIRNNLNHGHHKRALAVLKAAMITWPDCDIFATTELSAEQEDDQRWPAHSSFTVLRLWEFINFTTYTVSHWTVLPPINLSLNLFWTIHWGTCIECKLSRLLPRTDFRKRSFCYDGALFWNSFSLKPRRQAQTLQSFRVGCTRFFS